MAKINKDMKIGELAEKYPESISILMEYGFHCIGCHVSAFETIEEGALAHGMDEKTLDEMIKKMNKAIEKKK